MATTDEVPAKYDIGIDGRGYMVDTQYLEAYRSQTLDPIRRQGDSSSSVGEASLNPEGYWRRSPESWHKGAGQSRYDASDSDPERFYGSRGVDVWTEGQLTKLPAVDLEHSLTLTGAYVLRCKGRVLLESGGGPIRTWTAADPSVTTSYAGPLGDITAFEYDGGTGWIVDSGHLYTGTNAFTSMATPWISGDPTTISDVAFVGGRLLCLDTSGNLYDVSSSGLSSLPTALMTMPSGFTTFAGYTSADGYIYFAAGTSGVLTTDIYRTTIKTDGTALDVPTIAAEIPEGEAVGTLFGYLGLVVVGLGVGLRLGIVGADGDLTLGSPFLNDTSSELGYINNASTSCNKYLAEGRFVYVPYHLTTSGPVASNGCLRLDLSIINDSFVPAFAADLAPDGGSQEFFMHVVDHNGIKQFVTRDGEIWEEHATEYASSAVLSMGEVSFGTRENKLFLDPVEAASDGTVTHRLTTPDGTHHTDTNVTTPEPTVTWLMTLTADTSTADMTLQYPILRALPAPTAIDQVSVPLLLHGRVTDRKGQANYVDTDEQLTYLKGLRDGALIDFQNGGASETAQVIGVDWYASDRDLDGDQWEGTAVVRLKVL